MATQNNFILIIEEIQEPKLLIALKWMGGVTDFIDLSNSAFPSHPKAPGFSHGFVDYEDAHAAKVKWQNFLSIYLDKNLRKW